MALYIKFGFICQCLVVALVIVIDIKLIKVFHVTKQVHHFIDAEVFIDVLNDVKNRLGMHLVIVTHLTQIVTSDMLLVLGKLNALVALQVHYIQQDEIEAKISNAFL